MTRPANLIGLLLLAGLGFYVFSLSTQSKAAAELCENHPVGTRLDDPGKLGAAYGLTLRGPIEFPEKPGAKRLIYCADLALCDTSCSLVIEGGRVTESSYFSH